MPLLITQNDLRPMLADPAAMDTAFKLFEATFLEYDGGKPFRTPNVELPVAGAQKGVQLNLSSSTTFGVAIRAYPAQERVHPDSHVNLLFDKDRGQLLAMIDGEDMHALRTAIPVGVAARWLQPASAKVMGVLGSGRQGRSQAETIIHAIPGIERILVYSPTEEHRRAYAREVAPSIGLPVEALDSPQAVVEQADVVVLAARAREPVLESRWVRPGALVLSVNSAQIPPELVERSRVVLGYRAERQGEPYASMTEAGRWSSEKVAASVGEVISGARSARERPDDVVLADIPGMPAWDVAMLTWAFEWAREHEVGTDFHLSGS
jgi:alanine dehydrogenase